MPFRRVIVIISLIFSSQVFATSYEPKDILEYERYFLPNGMQVILNQRGTSNTASLRLNVRIGESHFSCEKAETAHYLEHMIFDGTNTLSREKIKQLFDDNGVIWNAETAQKETTYILDVYSPRYKIVINTLYDMIANSILPTKRYEQTRDIINQELGGEPSWLKRTFVEAGFGRSAVRKGLVYLLPGTNMHCQIANSANPVTYEDLKNAYKKYYVPENMTFILTGNFPLKEIKSLLKETFGQLEKGHFKTPSQPFKMLNNDVTPLLNGTLNPLISAQTSVSYGYAVPGLHHKDYVPLQFIENYLYERLFEVLRMKHGIAYGPSADIMVIDQQGAFFVGADVEHKDVEKAKELILKEIQNLKGGKIDTPYFDKTKKALLVSLVHSYETNSDYSNTYEGSLNEFEAFGHILSNERIYKNMTPEKMRVLANRYFISSNRIDMIGSPSMTPTQFTIFLALLIPYLIYVVYRLTTIARRKIKANNS